MSTNSSHRVCVHCGNHPDLTTDQAALEQLLADVKQQFNDGAFPDYQKLSFVTGLVVGWNEHAKRETKP